MTTSVQIPPVPSVPAPKAQTRRALLAGALGGLGALVAGAIGRTSPVRAGVDGDVVLGSANTTTSSTTIANTSAGVDAFVVTASGAGTGVWGTTSLGVGLRGESTANNGVWGSSSSSVGVVGTSSSGAGVNGYSSGAVGVWGQSSASSQPACLGQSYGNSTAVLGVSGSSAPAVPAKTGVFGYAAQDATAVGVHGESVEGIGLLGLATGSGTAAFGLFARSNSTAAAAIGARSAGNSTALLAMSGTGTFPTAKPKTAVYGYANQDNASHGVWGDSPVGIGVVGSSTSGYAGYFVGKVYSTAFYELNEISTPATPSANRARLFIKDNGLGKTQLCVKFDNGTVKVLATEG